MHTGKEIIRFVRKALMGLLWASATMAKGQEIPALSVCELFQDPQSWSGKVVAIYGEYETTLHDSGLTEQDCAAVPESEGTRWPTFISLSFQYISELSFADQGELIMAPANADPRSLKFFLNLHIFLLDAYQPGWRSDRYKISELPVGLSATFIGILRTSKQYELFGRSGQKIFQGGFGYRGRAPLQLDLLAVREVTITRLSAKFTPDKPKTE